MENRAILYDNSSGLTRDQISKLKVLGTFRNRWRLRDVTLLEYPNEPDTVITIGVGYAAAEGRIVICREHRADYARQLEQNDWTPFN